MGATHRLLGASAALAWAAWVPLHPAQTAVALVVATVTSAGPTSPDVDRTGPWQLLDRLLPDELLGHRGPLQHRGLSHWWGLPALALLVAAALPAQVAWLAHAAVLGWCSHLLGDLLFGQADPRGGRGPGIPLLPWWGHVGLGLDVDGPLERVVVQRLALPALLAWQTLDALGLAGPLWQRLGQTATVAFHR